MFYRCLTPFSAEWPLPGYLAKERVLLVQLVSAVKGNKELTAVVVAICVGHAQEPAASELETLVDLILAEKRNGIGLQAHRTASCTQSLPLSLPYLESLAVDGLAAVPGARGIATLNDEACSMWSKG